MMRVMLLVVLLVVVVVLVLSWVRASRVGASRDELDAEAAERRTRASLEVYDARADQVAARVADTWRHPSAHLLDTQVSARLVAAHEGCSDAASAAHQDPTPATVEVYAAALARAEEAVDAAREQIRRRELGE